MQAKSMMATYSVVKIQQKGPKMRTGQLILEALKEKAPQLLAELKESGSLDQFLQDKTEQISSLTNSLAMQIAKHHGMDKAE